MKRILQFIIVMLIPVIANSQSINFFTTSEVDASEFPDVKVGFRAYDGAGQSYDDLIPEDFDIIENFTPVDPNSIEIECDYPPLSIVLVIDQSRSMSEEVDGEMKWDWVKEGVITFLEEVPLNSPESQIALTTFATTARLRSDFTRDKEALFEIVNNLSVLNTSTNFNVAFLDENFGAIELLKKSPIDHNRIIVFLTDGKHENITEQLYADSITSGLRAHNIQLYAITLLDEQNSQLSVIAQNSGGDYDRVSSKKSLTDLYNSIALLASEKISCTLKWTSNPACDEITSFRSAEITMNRLNNSVIRNYKAPPGNFVSISSDKDIYDFGNPDVGNSVEQDIVITADNFPMDISGFRIVPDTYFEIDHGSGYGVDLQENLLVPQGESLTIKARFTQQDIKTPRQATLVVESLPCNYEVALVGGFSQINVLKPEAGDLFSTCDPIDIVWTGVEPNVQVNLYYSTNGNNWIPIAQGRTGLRYTWNNPPDNSTNLQIKAEVKPQNDYKWVNSTGGAGNEIATSLDVGPSDLYVYVSGYFSGAATFGNQTFSSNNGSEDAFIAKYDSDGNFIWVRTAHSPNNDRANGVVTDPEGNVYIVGYTYNGVQFGNYKPGLQEDDLPYAYIAKYTPAGDLAETRFFGARNIYTEFQTLGNRIRYFEENGNPRIMIRGTYMGEFYDWDNNYVLPEETNWRPFTLTTDLALDILDVVPQGPVYGDYSDRDDTDTENNIYRTASYQGSTNIGGFGITSAGENDFYISKFGVLDVSEDISDEFEIDIPQWELSISDYDFGECILGDTCRSTITSLIKNTGRFPITIRELISGPTNPDDFMIDESILNEVIEPGDSINVIIKFAPQYFNDRNASLIFRGDCVEDLVLNVTGIGACFGYTNTPINFGDVYVNKTETITETCIFQNPTNLELDLWPQILGDNWQDFTVTPSDPVKVMPDGCLELEITFTPSNLGERTAEIDLRMPVGCEPAIIELIGNGIEAEVTGNNLDFGEQRVLSNVNGELILDNFGGVDQDILDIELLNPELSDIFEITLPTLPQTISAEGDYRLPVTFNPSEEIDYNAQVRFTISNQENPVTLDITGTGILPKLDFDWVCSEDVNVGEQSTATLRLLNPSQSADLVINSINISNQTNEFYWANGNPGTLNIEKESSQDIDLIYTPQNNGNGRVEFTVEADNFDGTFQGLWRNNVIEYYCDALSFEANDVDFGQNILCNSNSKFVTVENTSDATPLVIETDDINISGTNAAYFDFTPVGTINVDAQNSFNIEVTYTPTEKGNHSAILTIPNSSGNDIQVNLTGESIGIQIISSNTLIEIQPGNIVDYTILADIPSTDKGIINNLIVELEYNAENIFFDENSVDATSIQSVDQNWTWDNISISTNGNIRFEGSGNLPTPFDGEIFTIQFTSLLTDVRESEIYGIVDYTCNTDRFKLTDFFVEEICVLDARTIELSGVEFNMMDPAPNPVKGNLKLDFSIGLNTQTNIELYDVSGNLIFTFVDERLSPGFYSLSVDTKSISSGTYYLIMNSGPFSDTKSVIISK